MVVDAAPGISSLLEWCPCLTVLATSRVVLHLSDEHHVPVGPLPRPDAVQLFQGATPDATPGTPVGTPQATPLATSAAPVAISAFLAFEPKGVTIPAMIDIVVTLPNNGLLQHNWDVLGTALMTAIVGSDAVETVTVNLPAGSYDFQCDVPGHAEAGMVGTLTVQ